MSRSAVHTTLVLTSTSTALVVGADNIANPTTWTGTIKGGTLFLTSGLATSLGTPSTAGLMMPTGVPGVTTTNLYNNGGVLTWAAVPVYTGSVTTGTIPKASGSGTLVNSVMVEAAGIITVSGDNASSISPFIISNSHAGGGQVSATLFAGSSGNAVAGDALIQNTIGHLFLSPNTVGKNLILVGGAWTNTAGITVSSTAVTVGLAATFSAGIANTGTISAGTWSGTAIDLTHGGTNAALTASNGGIVYSTASALAILSATATANKLLVSGASGAPTWSTPTFPNASATSGKIIVSDGTNWVASTPTFPNASATSGKVIISDGTNWIASTPTRLNAGTANRVTYWSSANVEGESANLTFDGTTLAVGSSNIASLSIMVNSSTTTGFTYGGGDTGQVIIKGGGTTSATFGANFITIAPATTFTLSATATAFIPSGATVPTNGMYLPAANNVAIATNSVEAIRIYASGGLSVKATNTDPGTGAIGADGVIAVNGRFTDNTSLALRVTNATSGTGTTAVFDTLNCIVKLTSSERHKEHIEDWAVSHDALDQFIALTPKVWDYTGKATGAVSFTSEQLAGLPIVNPYGVSPMVNYDLEGRPDSNRDYSLIALQHLVAQDHHARIQAIEAALRARGIS